MQFEGARVAKSPKPTTRMTIRSTARDEMKRSSKVLKKKGKSDENSSIQKKISAVRYQAMKAIRKGVKVAKGLLIQRCARRLNQLRTSGKDESKEVMRLNSIKMLDYAKLAEQIYITNLGDGSDDDPDNNKMDEMDEVTNLVLQHKKVLDPIMFWKERLACASQVVDCRTRSEIKTSDIVPLNHQRRRRINIEERSKAVFIDSLQEDVNPRIGKTQQRGRILEKREKAQPPDLSIYGPGSTSPSSIQLAAGGMIKEGTEENRNTYVPRNSTRIQFPPSTASESKLHPSWLAKQRQKQLEHRVAANNGTNKKILFSD